MSKYNLSEIDQMVMLGKQLEAFNDQLGQKLLQLYHLGILDSWSFGQIKSRVE
ncbi:MAG: hypothetical protein JEZ07_14590, partial [Phycisphaerae bacterium]|nr:hypothetical protein [Phycisphaerae bacterium]